MKNKHKTKLERLMSNRLRKRLEEESTIMSQKGGKCSLSASGSFGNMVDQLGCMVVSGVKAIVKGVDSAYSVIELPSDLAWDFNRPNEPTPQNTPVPKYTDNS